jgi:hypothetical protein
MYAACSFVVDALTNTRERRLCPPLGVARSVGLACGIPGHARQRRRLIDGEELLA